MSCLTANDATRVSYRRFVGKTGREETGDTEKQWAFQYVVAMETGNAQYLSNAAEVYVSEISKRICPGLIRASGERTYRFSNEPSIYRKIISWVSFCFYRSLYLR